MKKERVFVTGMGCVSSIGSGYEETLFNFKENKSFAGSVTLFETDLACPVFEVGRRELKKKGKDQMRTMNLLLDALAQALNDAGFKRIIPRKRVGVCIGTTVASQLNDINFYKTYKTLDKILMRPVDRFLKSNLSERIKEFYSLRGPCVTVVNACSSGADAIGVALNWILGDICDLVICGGADELSLIPLCGFNSLGVVSDELCMPFDQGRKGLNLGEGAGIFILEKESFARERKKDAQIGICGFGQAQDAYHLTAPHPQGLGLEMAIRAACAGAGLQGKDIAFVNAHGTATIDNDKVEGAVLRRVFGDSLIFLSTNVYTGHTLGAAGAL